MVVILDGDCLTCSLLRIGRTYHDGVNDEQVTVRRVLGTVLGVKEKNYRKKKKHAS